MTDLWPKNGGSPKQRCFIAGLTPDKPYSCKIKLYMVVKQLPYNLIASDVNSLCKLRFFSFTVLRKVDRKSADGHCPISWWGWPTCSLAAAFGIAFVRFG